LIVFLFFHFTSFQATVFGTGGCDGKSPHMHNLSTLNLSDDQKCPIVQWIEG
jgi:hypothetical protein